MTETGEVICGNQSNASNINPLMSEKSKASLGSLLELSPSRKKKGAASVGGNLLKLGETSEIYIRADGKKVRKIKRVVPRGSASVADDATTTSEIYIRPDGKKVRRIVLTKSLSPAAAANSPSNGMSPGLAGFLSTATGPNPVRGAATVTGAETDGEIVIRPDGKKVRRIRKTVPATVEKNAPTEQLSGFLSASNGGIGSSPKQGSATVAGGAAVGGLGEIYINAAGKKVRRVLRSTSDSSAGSTLAPLGGYLGVNSSLTNRNLSGTASVSGGGSVSVGDVYINAEGRKVRRVVKGGGGSIGGGGAASVAGDMMPSQKAKSIAEGEIYVRADGKKVRRVKRSNSSLSTASSVVAPPSNVESLKSLDGFFGNRTCAPGKNITGSATVAGDRVSSKIDGGEIYVNAQGKKVRRVRKARTESVTQLGLTHSILQERAAKAAGAANAVANDEAETRFNNIAEPAKPLSPAWVKNATPTSGDAPSVDSSSSPPRLDLVEAGEIYINADGKKVRRVKRNSSASSTGLDSMMLESKSKPGAAGSATVSGDTHDEGEIYIRADGKKVRRVRRSQSIAAASLGGFLQDGSEKTPLSGSATVVGDRKLDGEIIIRPDGKKVIRRIKSIMGSSASLAGDASSVGGEVYRNAEGKLVRRVKRAPSSASISAALKPAAGPLHSNSTLQNLARSASNDSAASTTSATQDSATPTVSQKASLWEKKSTEKVIGPTLMWTESSLANRISSTTAEISASTIALIDEEEAVAAEFRRMRKRGLPDDAVRHRMTINEVNPKIIASVMGDEWAGDTVKQQIPLETCASSSNEALPSTPAAPSFHLTSEEEEVASVYRKMKKMGLPDDAVRHKMSMGEVSPKIIAAVMGEEWSEEPSRQSSSEIDGPSLAFTPAESTSQSPVASIKLSGGEEAIASVYRKMQRMGLPDDAVRHKMITSDVHPKIMAAVLGDEWSDDSFDEAPPTSKTAALTTDDETIAAQFRRMLSMGLPNDAVRHKMIVSEVCPKVIAAVLGEEWTDESPKTASTSLTDVKEAIAAEYRKMLMMGLSDDAVRHKMVLGDVDPKIIATVFGEKDDQPQRIPPPTGSLSDEEEAIAAQYRKMQQMGLPDDAVRHKMVVSEVDPRIIAAVFRGQSKDQSGTQTGGSPKSAADTMVAKAPNAVAYVVIVGDDPAGDASVLTDVMDDNSVESLCPDEKFAVKVADEANPHSPTKKTKFFTLDELAKLSGQSKIELEAIVTEKRRRGASPPRFSLLPLQEKKYEVTMPRQLGESATQPQPHPNLSGVDPSHVKEVKEGQEVVDSELARAARAMTAMGDGDMSALLEKLKAGDMKDLLEKLQEAEKRQKKLEKQLAQAGVAIAEDIEYQEAKGKVEAIAKRMNEIGGSDVQVADKDEQNRLREEYFKLEQEMERYNTALVLSEEYQAEQDRLERKWEADNMPDNIAALKMIRRHMPVNIRNLSEADLTTKPSPNGKYLPVAIAKKFKRTNILQCLRLNPDDLECMHPATLENMRVTGLTLTERRALYIHFQPVGPKWEKNKAEKMTERKWTWYQMMKNNFKENVAPYQRHIDQYGGPQNHTCPLIGKQCPVKADKNPDYDGDYGWTENPEYELSDVRKADVEDSGAKAMAEALALTKEKKANERADVLKKHYKGKLLQVSKANGSCEAMDESMEQMENYTIRWIETMLDKGETGVSEADKKKEVANFTDALNEFKLKLLNFAQRSGMQMSGKKTAGGDSPDIRSSVEGSLAEEVFETSVQMFVFIRYRMKQLVILDTRAAKTIEMLEGILNELHHQNLALFEALGAKRMNRSRKLKTMADLKKEVEERRKAGDVDSSPEEEKSKAPLAPGGRGGLMDSIAGHGRGGGGRGGLLDAISGRGVKGPSGGRGGLMDAIAGRGRGRGGGGRGGLLDAIAGRGDGGGRGGLMAAIAGRSAGRGRGGGGESGRGGLMAAIAARSGDD